MLNFVENVIFIKGKNDFDNIFANPKTLLTMNTIESRKILIVEDDEMLRESTALFLSEEGYRVFTAKNGIEGVEKAMENIPDMILCDISMPRMDGYDVYKILSDNSATNFIPFIFLTAKAEKEDIRVGMQMGVDDYITKPFDYDELLKAIELRISKREKIISASEGGFKALLDSTLAGIFIYQNDKITYANSKLLKIFGLVKEEIPELNLLDFTHKDDVEVLMEKIRRCLKGIQSNFNISFRAYTKKKELIYLDCWGSLTKIYGQNALIASVINLNEYRSLAQEKLLPIELDSTEIREAEDFIEESDDLPQRNPDNLTRREIEVLQQICLGLTNHEIADKLFLSVRTVDTHRGNLLSKTGVANTAGLVVYAIKYNLFKVKS